MLTEDKCVSETAGAWLGQSSVTGSYGIDHPKSVRFKEMTLSLSSGPYVRVKWARWNPQRGWNLRANPRMDWLDDSSCAERNSQSFTPTSCKRVTAIRNLWRGQPLNSQASGNICSPEIHTTLQLGHRAGAGLGGSGSCEAERRGRSGSLVRGNRTPAGVLFIAGSPIVFYGREGYICP